MATRAKRGTGGTAEQTAEQRGRLIAETALRLAGERGWRDLSLADIGEASGLGLAAVTAETPNKAAVLARFTRMIDEAVLAEPADAGEPARDRLFDVLMRRFDALAPYKAGMRAIDRDLRRDPLAALCLLPLLHRSMASMLEAARLAADGTRGAVRVHGLSAIWVRVLDTWLGDDTEDQARTMKALDRELKRADDVARFFHRGRRPAAPADAAGAAEAV